MNILSSATEKSNLIDTGPANTTASLTYSICAQISPDGRGACMVRGPHTKHDWESK
jgi:hypothetical protein